MKKNIKKFLGVFLSALLVILPILSTNVEKVAADDAGKQCETFTNYYFFLLVADPSTDFKGKLSGAVNSGASTFDVTHNSVFKTSFPENVDENSAQPVWIDIGAGQDGWDKEKWWNTFLNFGDLSGEGQIIPDSNDSNIRYYAHESWWYYEGSDSEELDTYTSPKKYDLQENLLSTFTTTTGNSNINTFTFSQNSTMALGIKRTINVKSWQDFAAEQQGRYVGGEHPTERHMWLPGLLKVTYEAECKEETPEFDLTIHYLEEGTDKELKSPKNAGTYVEGATYSETCDSIDNYTFTKDSNLTGTMPANDHDEYCYYKLNEEGTTEPDEPTDEPTYKVTVNYLDKKTEEPIADPKVTQGFKNGESYIETCPDSLVNGTYVNTPPGYTGNLSGKIAGKDVVINCLYSNENEPTSDIPIYIVWGVGGAALAYSVYYFRKYYKQENNA